VTPRFLLAALLFLASGLWAQTTTQEYKELAGTVVLNERILPVLKSGGMEYLLLVEPQEAGAQALRNGLAIIVKGLVSTIVEDGQPTRVLLRPYEVTIRNQTIPFKRLPDDQGSDPP
jgi:hypothetical protein